MPASAIPPENFIRHIPKRSWILRSKARVRLFAAAAGLAVVASTAAAHWFFYNIGKPPIVMMFASDVLAGLLVTLLIVGVLERIVDRGEAVRARLEMIALMNHHVRNALQVIAFTAHSTRDQQAIARINDAAQRIDWALRQILGSSGFDVPGDTKFPGEHPA